MSTNWQNDVLEFHRAFCPEQIAAVPTIPTLDIERLRLRLIREERTELIDAFMISDLSGIADALVDLLYVTIGTAVACGIDLGPLWNAVHAANMAKAGGPRREDGKKLKPANWQPPDIAGILAAQKPIAIEPTSTP